MEFVEQTQQPEYLCNLGLIYFDQREFHDALRHFQEAQEIYTQQNNHSGIVTCLMNIAWIHDAKDNYEAAMNYLYQALCLTTQQLRDVQKAAEIADAYHIVRRHLAERIEEKMFELLVQNQLNIGELMKMEQTAYSAKRFQEANYIYDKALAMAYLLNDPSGMIDLYRHRNDRYSIQTIVTASLE